MIQHPSLSDEVDERLVIVEGRGSSVRDMDGREYLDAYAGGRFTQIGHGRPEIAEIMAEQMLTLEHFGTGGNLTNPPAIMLAERILAHAPQGIRKVSYASSGSEACDEAVRLIREFQHRRGHPERYWIISVSGSYHGRTLAGAALRGWGEGAGYGPVLPGFVQVPAPRDLPSDPAGTSVEHCLRELRSTIETVGPNHVAAFFAEPLLGARDLVVPLSQRWWAGVTALLAEFDIPVVLDEITTGFGRTGTWFGAEHYGLSPDLMITANGIAGGYLPLAALLYSERAAEALAGADSGGSYGGHAAACAVAAAVLDVIEKEGLVANAAVVGDRLAKALAPLRRLDAVGDVRGLGLLAAVELVAVQETREPCPVDPVALERMIRQDYGVLVGVHTNTVTVAPPLVLTEAQAELLGTALQGALARVRPDGSILRRES
ncbi:aspartate aminotransferase family protein [Streptomyces sp. NPDC091280]|uniref:aminotransferase family protein n=1 Tax=Streptomyces sp. NPDC091280 TaxID=3365984 RepID=UPI003823037D